MKAARGMASSRAMRAGAAAAALIAGLGAASGAQAADEASGLRLSSSLKERLVFNPATVTTRNATVYSTQILGRLNGGAPLYDKTFGFPFSDPASQAGVVAARAAITTAGGPGVIIGAPVLTASSTNTSSSSVTTYSLAGTESVTGAGVVTFGPATLYVGTLSVCNVGSLPSTAKPTCQDTGGQKLALGPNETNINVHTATTYTLDQATTTTNTTTQFEQWTLFGVVQSVGLVHTAVQSGAFDAASRFLRRMGDEVGNGSSGTGFDRSRRGGWAEFHGATARSSAGGGIPGDRRDAYGFAGGFIAPLSETFMLGVGVDHGRTDIALDSDFAETGVVTLTELGVNAGFRSRGWFANAAATYGFGDADTTHAVAGASTASYDLRTWGLLGEAGYRFDLGGLRVTPSIGGDHVDLRTHSFTETGGLALVAPSHSADRTRAWLGLDVGHTRRLASAGAFDLSGYGRVVQVLSGDERLLPVAFAVAPAVPMTITGNRENRTGFDLGARASYSFNSNASLFVAYDGRFRDGFDAHQGRIGLKLSF